MLKNIIRFFSIILIFVYGAAFADATQELVQQLSQLKQAQGNFEQTLYGKHDRVLQQTQGKFALSRPGKFRWETQQPSSQLLVADGSKVWSYDQALQQVIVQKQPKQPNSPAFLLSGDLSKLSQDYKITQAAQGQANVFVLIPVSDKNSFFSKVQLSFANKQLAGMQIWDKLGQRSDIAFTHIENKADTSLFHFVPPKGVDVVQG